MCSELARSTPGFAGADLENLVNEAALLAARRSKERVEMSDFELAKDKVLMGAERRSMVMSLANGATPPTTKAGHALVAMLLPGADPVHKVTIIPRGMALGVTQQFPLDDRYTYSRDYLMTRLAMMFGGRVAEELVFDHMTTGRRRRYREGDRAVPQDGLRMGHEQRARADDVRTPRGTGFPRPRPEHSKDYSEHTALEIDREVRRIVDDSYQKARSLLTEHLACLHALAERLLEKEVVDGAEVAAMVKAFREGRPLPMPCRRRLYSRQRLLAER